MPFSGSNLMTNLDKSVSLLTKGPHKVVVFKVMYWCELTPKEGWVLRIGCFETVVLEKIWEPEGLRSKPVHSWGDQLLGFLERTMLGRTPWYHSCKELTTGIPDAGRDWGQEGTTEMRQPDGITTGWILSHGLQELAESERSCVPRGCKSRHDWIESGY